MKMFLISLLLVGSLFAGTYDDPYSALDKKGTNISEKSDQFMYGDFLEILRFNSLDFSDGELSGESEKYLEEILVIVNDYIKIQKDIHIKIIGHSSENRDNTQEALDISKSFASDVAKRFEDNNINKKILTVESRGLNDKAFSSETTEGMDLSNRVMVTMYVVAPKDKDSDGDGVLDSKDKCPNTPSGVKVDEAGCPFDSDKDGVLDYKDECPDTPIGVAVDEVGCPFDNDSDGVLNYKDNCPDTMQGLTVDAVGCPVSKVLRLNFETDSADIIEASKKEVAEFAEFLKENPAYKAQIVGHTDSVGKSGYNMKLSLERSNSVKSALIEWGVEENRLETLGRGELSPLETNRTAAGRATNRRIEVKLFN